MCMPLTELLHIQHVSLPYSAGLTNWQYPECGIFSFQPPGTVAACVFTTQWLITPTGSIGTGPCIHTMMLRSGPKHLLGCIALYLSIWMQVTPFFGWVNLICTGHVRGITHIQWQLLFRSIHLTYSLSRLYVFPFTLMFTWFGCGYSFIHLFIQSFLYWSAKLRRVEGCERLVSTISRAVASILLKAFPQM